MDIELRSASMTETGRDTIAVTGTRDEVERTVDLLWEREMITGLEAMARAGERETWVMALEEGVLEGLSQVMRENPPDQGEVRFLET